MLQFFIPLPYSLKCLIKEPGIFVSLNLKRQHKISTLSYTEDLFLQKVGQAKILYQLLS